MRNITYIYLIIIISACNNSNNNHSQLKLANKKEINSKNKTTNSNTSKSNKKLNSNGNTPSEKVFQVNDSVGNLKKIKSNELKKEIVIDVLDTISITVDNVISFSKALDDMGLAEIKSTETHSDIINKLSYEEIKGILLHIENQIINYNSLNLDNNNLIFYYNEKPFDGVAKILDTDNEKGTKYQNFKNGKLNGRYFHTGIVGGYSYSGNYKNGKKHGRFIDSKGEGWGYQYVDYIDGVMQDYVFVDLFGIKTDNIGGKESFLIYLEGLQ